MKLCVMCKRPLPAGSYGNRKFCGCKASVVYRFVCPDGRSYVGSTRDHRERSHRGIQRKNPQLIEAFALHPPKTWTYEVLERLPAGRSRKQRAVAEQRHIDRLRTWAPEHGFNMLAADATKLRTKEYRMRISTRASKNWASTPRVKPPVHKPMTQEEFQALCHALKIEDNGTAAELFDLNWRTCQRYWYGELQVPGPLARLLRLAAACEASHAQLRQLAKPVAL